MSRTVSAPVAVLFGRRVRALRKMRRLTQEQLGEGAHVSAKFVGQIERGTANPSLDLIARLAHALDVELWDLARFEEQRAEGPVVRAAAAHAAAEKVATYLSGRPAVEIERAYRLIEVALGSVDPPGKR